MTRVWLISLTLLLLTAGGAFGNPLTLQNALAKASAASRALRIVGLEENVAAEAIGISRSGYLPRVDFQGGYTALQAPQAIAAPQGTFETQQDNFGYFSLSLYQTLYDFGRTAARTTRSKAVHDAVQFDYQSQQQEIFLQTVAAYFRILQGQKLVEAANQEAAQMADHLRLANNLYEQGIVTRNDLLQAEVRLAGSRQRSLDIANRLDNAWLVLNDILGEPSEHRRELVEGSGFDQLELEKPAPDAVMNRAELLAQRKLVESGEAEISETRSSFYPEFFTRLGIDYIENSRVKEQAIMAVTVGLKVNLFEGYATTARYRQAFQKNSRNQEKLHQLKADLMLEYRMAINDAKVAARRISVVETAIRQGEENLRINKDRYEEQVGTATDVIDAQTLLTQIRSDYYQAAFDYQVAVARVKRAKGEL